MPEKTDKKLLLYKGKPLVRKGKTICYGSVDDKYVLVMTILSTKKENDREIPNKVLVQIQHTDANIDLSKRVEKFIEKNSLYDAFEIGEIWLKRLLSE